MNHRCESGQRLARICKLLGRHNHGIHMRNDASQKRAIDDAEKALPRNIGMIRKHTRRVSSKQGLAYLADRIRMMEMDDVNAQAAETTQKTCGHWRRGEPAVLRDPGDCHTIHELLGGGMPHTCCNDLNLATRGLLHFRQESDVLLYSTHHAGKSVLVEVGYAHSMPSVSRLSPKYTCCLPCRRLSQPVRSGCPARLLVRSGLCVYPANGCELKSATRHAISLGHPVQRDAQRVAQPRERRRRASPRAWPSPEHDGRLCPRRTGRRLGSRIQHAVDGAYA